jgi:hypothetical protein
MAHSDEVAFETIDVTVVTKVSHSIMGNSTHATSDATLAAAAGMPTLVLSNAFNKVSLTLLRTAGSKRFHRSCASLRSVRFGIERILEENGCHLSRFRWFAFRGDFRR